MLKERASERGVRYAGTGVTAGTNSLTFLEPRNNEVSICWNLSEMNLQEIHLKQRDSIEVGQQQSGFM